MKNQIKAWMITIIIMIPPIIAGIYFGIESAKLGW